MTRPSIEEVASIADGLTAGQKQAVLQATVAHQTKGVTVLPIYRDGGAMSRSLVALDLARYSVRGAALTKLGKAVREHLERTP